MAEKKINNEDQLEQWKKSGAYSKLVGFIKDVNSAILSKPLSFDIGTQPEVVSNIIQILSTMDSWIDEYPPVEQPARFGNKAFRQWQERLFMEAFNLCHQVVVSALSQEAAEQHQSHIEELASYLKDSFGNSFRIDYGTGHEATFVAWMTCLYQMNAIRDDDLTAIGLKVFPRYMALMRKLQDVYRLEPAGSHGVWGLDDYHFIPFIWGAAQLIDNPIGIKPATIHDSQILRDYSSEYMYLDCIRWIKDEKKGPFFEHSPILNDVSQTVKTWNKINSGMIKMFHGEVLHKFPVIQHFLFGTLLPFEESAE
eukprot:gb/GECH01013912.1/.p1 GENE.gb/GECH01013912.1/~~gb/GECH01013912.1/.p1  ORF type:complete len:310 (+),score=76.50 gb/GECH01013912.1/:1-930(+)